MSDDYGDLRRFIDDDRDIKQMQDAPPREPRVPEPDEEDE